MRRLMYRLRRSERGASAVEFAMILPILIVLVVGIAEFGRAFQVKSTLAAAAREGVRTMALQNNQSAARATVENVASSLNPAVTDAQITITPASCPTSYPTTTNVTLTISYRLSFFTGFFGSGVNLTGQGVMRCNG